MSNTDKVILVTGATGQQGGAAAKHLLEQGWPMRALVRDGNSRPARELAAQGVDLVLGDLEDRASVDRAVDGAYGVFSVQTFMGPDGPAGESAAGQAVSRCSKERRGPALGIQLGGRSGTEERRAALREQVAD